MTAVRGSYVVFSNSIIPHVVIKIKNSNKRFEITATTTAGVLQSGSQLDSLLRFIKSKTKCPALNLTLNIENAQIKFDRIHRKFQLF